MRLSGTVRTLFLCSAMLFLAGCETLVKLEGRTPVVLPYIKNTANECYYLDDFMPVPDSMVTGEAGLLRVRYYTYKFANYRNWQNREIVLSFYSRDEKCWSLFEEFYLVQ